MSSSPGADAPLVRMEGITKHFGGTHALEGVTFDVHAGEVHALCGENGAGKSTLMRILAGVIGGFDGAIRLRGRATHFSGPRAAEDAGIRMIHQELELVPGLSVAANLFLGRERRNRLGLLDERAMVADTRRILDRLGADIDPRARVGELRIGDQQMVEIAKSLALEAAVVIMDEPTSALSDKEVERLFRVIAEMKAAGTAVVYISHKMDEVFALAERVTVLRDGRLVATAARAQAKRDQIIRWMVGREIAAFHPQARPVRGEALLEVAGLSSPSTRLGRSALRDVSFTLHRGEVLGVAGLLGAGRTELLEALFGAGGAPPSGTIRLDGQPVRFRRPAQAVAAGLALVTEDRKNLGLFDQLGVGPNITVAHLEGLASRLGVVRRRAEVDAVRHALGRFGIKAAGGHAPITSLSGGNQQKCILARWLLTAPRVLLLDEPTRGIDVGAKAELYALIRDLAAHAGLGILMTSSELPELLAVCDRILVLCEGRQTALLDRAEASEESILHAATAFLERTPSAAG